MPTAKAAALKPRRSSPQARTATPAAAKSQPAIEGEFTVMLAPRTRKTLGARKAQVRTLMEVLGAAMDEAGKSGRVSAFRVEVEPSGRARVLPDTAPGDAEGGDDALDRALDAARRRGQMRAAEILSGDEMLSADEFAALLGVSRVTVNAKRQRGEVLALDGARRGFRFPAWQVDADGKPYRAIPRLFGVLGASNWGVYRFLMQRHASLDGARGIDALARRQDDAVVAAAEALAGGAAA